MHSRIFILPIFIVLASGCSAPASESTSAPEPVGVAASAIAAEQPLAGSVAGSPSLIQSRIGQKGNFELVTPASGGGLNHYFRANDDATLPWSGPFPFAQASGVVEGTSIIHSNF